MFLIDKCICTHMLLANKTMLRHHKYLFHNIYHILHDNNLSILFLLLHLMHKFFIYLYIYIVTSKTIAMPNLDTAREARCNHPWGLRLALVVTNQVQTLGYKLVPGSCNLAQPPWRYASSKTATPLQQFCTF